MKETRQRSAVACLGNLDPNDAPLLAGILLSSHASLRLALQAWVCDEPHPAVPTHLHPDAPGGEDLARELYRQHTAPCDHWFEGALVFAARRGLLPLVRTLLSLGADPTVAWSAPVRAAASEGQASALAVRLEAGAPFDPEHTGDALVEAVRAGHAPCVELLLASGAGELGTALTEAAAADRPDLVALLLATDTPRRGYRALYEASRRGHGRVVDQLLEAGFTDLEHAFGAACAEGHDRIVQRLLGAGADAGAHESAALRIAARNGHAGVVRLLCGTGAVDVRAGRDEAVRFAATRGHVEVVWALVAAGADVTAEGDEALRFIAGALGSAEVVRELLRAGAGHKEAALRRAAATGQEESVRELLAAGADVHAEEGAALKGAAGKGHVGTVRVLLAAGAGAGAGGGEALRAAVAGGHAPVAEVLRAAGAVEEQGGCAGGEKGAQEGGEGVEALWW
ncbi:hypothetical protein HYH03_017232 [Edaphochlamys debaryana]|uniref:Ankyrin repeat protein n=1 Tax=Edaphochlamys debaryana TaxID=47281 RepID=A0A836BP35_9CHLO|nr:hypothetical protein HYH03_017232 [Edaphochlamys debaryana]|eukprot:KAG2483911.1 hypothetical protein HYH03_017232 [Edaphochlamys debaryana]